MTKQEFRNQILEKFTSLTYFAEKAEIDYNYLLGFLNSDKYDSDLDHLIELFHNTEKRKENLWKIKDEDRKAIRLCILSNYDSYTDFSRTYIDYDAVYVVNIIKGNLTSETPKYQEFVKLLTANYDLDPLIWYRIKQDIKPNDDEKTTRN